MNRTTSSKKVDRDSKLVRTCSIWRALEIVGDAPTLLILESYWLGSRRFDEFCEQTGLLKTVVSARLKRLIENQCLSKVAYNERPKRYQYKATKQLLDFFPMALAMLHWERRWNLQKEKIKVELTHTSCAKVSEPFPVCKSCRAEVKPHEVLWTNGPGQRFTAADYSRRRRQTATPLSKTKLLDEIIPVIGDRWATLVLRSLFSGINQFQKILEDTSMSTNILSDRLSALCRDGFLQIDAVPTDSRRVEYGLTEKGLSVYPILVTLLEWGDKWRPLEEGAPMLLTHLRCGKPLIIEMACSSCCDNVNLGTTRFELR